MMMEAACSGVDIRLGCEVRSLDFDRTRVILASGEELSADVIIGADGNACIWSLGDLPQISDLGDRPVVNDT